MIEVSYNHKSAFTAAWVTGYRRFKDWNEFTEWLKDQLTDSPVLITSWNDL